MTNRASIEASRLSYRNTELGAPPNYNRSLYHILYQPHTSRLSEIISRAGFNRFVIAFDECSKLNFRNNWRRSSDMSLIALQRIIKAGDYFEAHGVSIWYLLLDTNPSIFGPMAPPVPPSPSDRLTRDLIPLPVWPYLEFNQMVPAMYSEGIRTTAQALSISHLKAYGRPVSGDISFYPHIASQILCFQYWSGLDNVDVLRAATHKLFCQSVSPRLKPFIPTDIDHVLAAFTVRVGLEIREGDASDSLAKDAVCSHMKILRGTVDSLVITTSPSEPILAIAAATSLNVSSEIYKAAIVTLVDRLVLRSLVLDRGIKGNYVVGSY